jgi:hypothetical protein
VVYPFPDATQYTAEQERAMNMASVQPWEIVAQNSTSGWQATFETIKPEVQAQMMGDNSAAIGRKAEEDTWYESVRKGLSNFVTGNPTEEQKAANNAAVDAEYQKGETNIVGKAVGGAIVNSVSDAWQKWGNETLVRVGVAVLALLVIYLALRKMV